MLTQEQNELLCRIGPGTPMGELVRRYWVPALLSWELPEPDCPSARVKLLGEELVAFRDTHGQIGMLQWYCAHRGAPLWLGRNEAGGLRCIYHGWKYDVHGNCVDQMNEPEEHSFKEKIHITSYPTLEMGGVIWTYMGPKEKQPPPPKFEWTQVPETHRHVSKVIQECNWVQAVEGAIDPSHAPILHAAFAMTKDSAAAAGLSPDHPFRRAKVGKQMIEFTDYGFQFWALRPLERTNLVLGHHFVAPWTQIRSHPNPKYSPGHFYVPIDDENCIAWNWQYSVTDEPLCDEERVYDDLVMGNGPSQVHQKTFLSYANRGNNWLVNREDQKTKSFSGIAGINTQDRAIQEGMGVIVDRSREHLGPADMTVIGVRQVLFNAMKIVAEGGDPPGVAPTYYGLRGVSMTFPGEGDWKEEMLALMHPASFAGRSE